MLKWSLYFMSRWQLRNFFAKLRNSRPVKTLMRLMIIKSTSHPKRMGGAGTAREPLCCSRCASRSLAVKTRQGCRAPPVEGAEAARPLEAPSSKDLINFTADLNECFLTRREPVIKGRR